MKNSKLKQNLEKTQAKIPKKTQKPATPAELNWRKIVQKKKPDYLIDFLLFLPQAK